MTTTIRFLHRIITRFPLITILVFGGAPVGCAMLAASGRESRVGTVEAGVEAQVHSAVSAALVQWKSTIVNSVSAQLETSLNARWGDNVGGDSITSDSLTSVILATGLILVIFAALTLYYRGRMSGSEKVSRRLITEIEKRRERTPCHCGKCADCMVDDLRRDQDKVARKLHEAVQHTTGNYAIRKLDTV